MGNLDHDLVVSPDITIVSTMYRSRIYLELFLAACRDAIARIGCLTYEILLVNDGSPDDSLAYVLEQQKSMRGLVIVDLSRNFGHHHAMLAGIQHARGKLIFLIDCDMEVSPLALVELHEKLRESDCDLVYGYQEARKGGVVERAAGGFFYKAFNFLSDTKIPENILTERVMTRRYADALLQLGDRNLFLGGMMTWVGFQQIGMPIKKSQRAGRSSYTILRRISLMVNAVSSFSAQPLIWLFNVGVTITSFSFLYVIYLLLRKILFDDALLGFTSMMALMTLSLGIMTTGLGVIGIYLGKVFGQVQGRPSFIVRDIFR